MSLDNRPIFALATKAGTSALHLHRLSGENIFSLLSPFLFLSQSNRKIDLVQLVEENGRKPLVRYFNIYDEQRSFIDDAIFVIYSSPKSYTGEDTIEISTHGNPLITTKLQSLLRRIGLRDAGPGEFSYRAVLNGKLDLVQAESIDQLIHSETYSGLDLARRTLSGVLSKETHAIREDLISILAYLEAHIDFAPDEVGHYEPKSLIPQLHLTKERLQKLLASYSSGLKMRDGVKVVLAGKPNAGKSSLYNALLRYERAIVTNIPGTTRDILEERLIIENRDFVLVDTAGLRKTEDIVEKIGVERSLQSFGKADIICLLIDLENIAIQEAKNHIAVQREIFLREHTVLEEQKLLVVVSKKDLIRLDDQEKIKTSISDSVLFVSKDETQNLNHKLAELHDELTGKNQKESPTLISIRQKDKVTIALQFLNEAEKLISDTEYPEKIASVLNEAQHSIAEIVGEIQLDNVYEKIFSTFCVGK